VYIVTFEKGYTTFKFEFADYVSASLFMKYSLENGEKGIEISITYKGEEEGEE